MSTLVLSDTPAPLPYGGVRMLLRQLGSPDEFGNPPPAYTGKVALEDVANGRTGSIFLRGGRVYAVGFTGFTPPIATRLFSGGMLTSEQYESLNSLAPEAAGDEAVRRGYVSADVVEGVNMQMLLSSLTHLYGWSDALWHWVPGAEAIEYLITGLEAALAVTAADERIGQWDALARNNPQVTKPAAVPQPGPDWELKAGESTSPEIAAILLHVDGRTNVARIATICGFTRFEIASRLAKAIADGLILIPDPDTGEVAGAEMNLTDNDPRQREYSSAVREVEDARNALAVAEQRLLLARQALGM